MNKAVAEFAALALWMVFGGFGVLFLAVLLFGIKTGAPAVIYLLFGGSSVLAFVMAYCGAKLFR